MTPDLQVGATSGRMRKHHEPFHWHSPTLIETVFAMLVAAAVFWTIWRFSQQGYLPQPFHYNPNESLSDLYKPAYWAHHAGGYDRWSEIYPPLSDVLIRLFSLPRCYAVDWIGGRQCDWPLRAMLVGFFIANVPLAYLAFRRNDSATAGARAAALCFGLPMLYGLDRGNLLVPCFTFFVLAEGGLFSSRVARWLSMGMALNLKPYLLVIVPAHLARKHWRWLLGCGVVSVAIYSVTYVLEGDGSPFQLVRNITDYGQNRAGPHYWASVYYASSYWPLARLIAGGFSFAESMPSGASTALQLAIGTAIRAAQLGCATCFIAACIRPAGVNVGRFTAMIAALALTTITTGSAGYAEVFILFLVFFEPWQGLTRPLILAAGYLLCIPFDVAIWPVHLGPTTAFLSGRLVRPEFGVSIGQLVRPGLLLVIQFGLIALNLGDILRIGTQPAAD